MEPHIAKATSFTGSNIVLEKLHKKSLDNKVQRLQVTYAFYKLTSTPSRPLVV